MSHNQPPEIDPQLAEFVERTMSLLVGRGPCDAPGAAGEIPGGGARAELPRQESVQLTIVPLAGDGSPRRIFRVEAGGTRAVAVANPLRPDRSHPDENEGFLAVREYLHQRKVRVPAFYAANLDRGQLLLEDLGDLRLADLRGTAKTMPAEAEPFYEQAIDYLVQMQMPGSPRFRLETTPNPAYTVDFILEQEARYFLTELVAGVCGLSADEDAVGIECRDLAVAALGATHSGDVTGATLRCRVFMHRDYQSRNLMIAGRTLAVIGFQGARLGPPEYDLAALLFDPYACLESALRDRLVEHYLARASASGVPGITPADWQRVFFANAANRLMQALGAFAKLGVRLARPGFREHIPAGLELLGQVLEAWGDAPRLLALVRDGCGTKCGSRPT